MESGGERPPFGDDDRSFDTDEPVYPEGSSPYDTGESPPPPLPPDTGEQQARPDPRPVPAHRRPSPRRGRHRDLPAKVRRRQAVAVAVIALVVVLGIYALASGGGGGDEKPSVSELPVGKLVGQTVIGRLDPGKPDKQLLARVRNGEIGGFVAFPRKKGGNQLKQQVDTLQQAAADGGNPPLMIAIDQEGGSVKRLAGPPTVSPEALGKSGDTDASQQQGQQTGEFLTGFGVNVNLAPVADVGHASTDSEIRDRTFGSDPDEVAGLVVAFANGLKDGGTAATVKHFPGLGYATQSPDVEPVTIQTGKPMIEADEKPFADAIDAGVPLVMMSTAKYTSFGTKDPAAWSEPIVKDELRGRLGFDGVIITDDLESPAVEAELPPNKAALRSLLVGVDMVMFATGDGASQSAYRQLTKQAESGKLSRSVLESAYDRITALKDGFST